MKDISYKEKILKLLEYYKFSTKLAEALDTSRMSILNWQDEDYNISIANQNNINSLFYAKVILPNITLNDIQDEQSKLIKMTSSQIKKYFLNQDMYNSIVSSNAQGSLEIETGTTKYDFHQIIQNTIIEKNIEKQKVLEVNNLYNLTKKVIKEALNKENLTINKIKNWHFILMQGIRDDAGEFSKYQRVIPKLTTKLTHPDNIEEELNLWLSKYKDIKSIKDIASAHINFELIHPFGDGNGRIGRLIMTYQLILNGYLPALVNMTNKDFYYESLSSHNNLALEYFILYACNMTQSRIKIDY